MKRGFTLIELLVVLAIIFILGGIFAGGCGAFGEKAKTEAGNVLLNEGYSNVTLERSFFGGREHANHTFKFTGYNRMTNYVEGIVTGDGWSGWSIRLF